MIQTRKFSEYHWETCTTPFNDCKICQEMVAGLSIKEKQELGLISPEEEVS